MRVVRWVAAVGRMVPLAAVAGILALQGLTAPADFADLAGSCTPQMREVVGSPCWSVPLRTDGDAVLAEAAEVARLTDGMECWDPSEGRLPKVVVVRAEAGVAVLPFSDETFAAAGRGEFVTLKACA